MREKQGFIRFVTASIGALVLNIAVLRAQEPGKPENRYDVFLKTFGPIVQVFCLDNQSGQRAVAADIRLSAMTGAPPEILGTRARIALEHPDKALLVVTAGTNAATDQALFKPGEIAGIIRDGQELRLIPGTRISPFIDALGDLPKAKKKYRFDPIALPVSQKQLPFLPAMFDIQDAGTTPEGYRIISVRLLPALADAANIEEWQARATVTPDYRPVRLEISRPEWSIAFEVERIVYGAALPRDVWELPSKDVMVLTPPRARQIYEALIDRTRNREGKEP